MNKNIDKLFQDKINQGLGAKPTADWNVFSEILKKSEGFEGIDFDKEVHSKLGEHKAFFNDNHWLALKERLIKEENLRKKIFTTKSLEALLLLLILFVFQNYENYSFDKETLPNGPIVMVDPNQTNIKENINTNSALSSVTSKAPIKLKSIDVLAYANSVEAYTITDKNQTVVNIEPIKNSVKNVSLNIDLQNESFSSNDLQKKLNDEVSINDLSPNHNLFLANNVPTLNPKIKIEPIKISLPNLSNKPIIPIHKNSQKFITTTINSGLGIAHSGYDAVYNIKGYSAYSSQFGAGVLYSIKNKNVELQTGLRYTRKTYEPSSLTEKYGDLQKGFSKISLEKISYDIVDVPLNLKFYFHQGKKISYFVKAGVNANFSLANTYTIAKESANQYQSKIAITDGAELDKTTELSKKDFNPGILQNSSNRIEKNDLATALKNNTFLTVTGEVGIEKQISKRNALVAGLEYNKYYLIDGFGPNKDKLSALTLNLGVKHSIN